MIGNIINNETIKVTYDFSAECLLRKQQNKLSNVFFFKGRHEPNRLSGTRERTQTVRNQSQTFSFLINGDISDEVSSKDAYTMFVIAYHNVIVNQSGTHFRTCMATLNSQK